MESFIENFLTFEVKDQNTKTTGLKNRSIKYRGDFYRKVKGQNTEITGFKNVLESFIENFLAFEVKNPNTKTAGLKNYIIKIPQGLLFNFLSERPKYRNYWIQK